MSPDVERARFLQEALPYIRKFSGKTIVVKYGGAAMEKSDLGKGFARDIVLLSYVGIRPVIVHGGGPRINRLLDELEIRSSFIDGQRVTDDATMEVVEMVLSGSINKQIVAELQSEGGKAVGISGKDASLATAVRYHPLKKNAEGHIETVDLGRVGKVNPDSINIQIIETLQSGGFIPVIAPVAADSSGESLNINADTMAGAIASALHAEKLVLLTDTPGVLAADRTIGKLSPLRARELIHEGVISGGMIPKVECCLHAVDSGVRGAHIIDGRVASAILLELFTDTGVGTLISGDG